MARKPFELTVDMGPAGISSLDFDVQAEAESAFGFAIDEAILFNESIRAAVARDKPQYNETIRAVELVAVQTGEGDVILHSWTNPAYSPDFALIDA